MSRELFYKVSLSINVDFDINVFFRNGFDVNLNVVEYYVFSLNGFILKLNVVEKEAERESSREGEKMF